MLDNMTVDSLNDKYIELEEFGKAVEDIYKELKKERYIDDNKSWYIDFEDKGVQFKFKIRF